MENGKEKKRFIKNFILMCLFLSSVFALTTFIINRDFSESVFALEKKTTVSKSDRMKIYAGGENIGVKISTKGVLAVAFSDIEDANRKSLKSPAEEAGIELGDVILKIDNKNISSSKQLRDVVTENKKGKVEIVIDRRGKEIVKSVTLVKDKKGDYKIGLWVRDSTAGIGTMSFYDENTGVYGALGHPITDSETDKILTVESGTLINSNVVNIRKGSVGAPGELKGVFVNEKTSFGTVGKNTPCGIFGVINKNEMQKRSSDKNNKLYEIAYKDEVEVGPAQIITTIDQSGPKYYSINIEKVLEQNKVGPKSMVIKVTDPELLEKTGGIVQGMSGSPIIQNGRIVGAVTHVLINKPDTGYGIYIEWMLKDANLLK